LLLSDISISIIQKNYQKFKGIIQPLTQIKQLFTNFKYKEKGVV
jgi:hypothetical protein